MYRIQLKTLKFLKSHLTIRVFCEKLYGQSNCSGILVRIYFLWISFIPKSCIVLYEVIILNKKSFRGEWWYEQRICDDLLRIIHLGERITFKWEKTWIVSYNQLLKLKRLFKFKSKTYLIQIHIASVAQFFGQEVLDFDWE